MASLKEQIDEKMKQAMRDKSETELSLFRMLKSSIKNVEIAKGHELEDAEVMAVFEKEAKQRRDSIEQFEAGGRADLAETEKKELAIIEAYLPEKMGEEEVRKAVQEAIAAVEKTDGSASSPQSFGKVMGMAMGKLKGQADGAMVQKIVREEMGA
jgi:uncharacterized protein